MSKPVGINRFCLWPQHIPISGKGSVWFPSFPPFSGEISVTKRRFVTELWKNFQMKNFEKCGGWLGVAMGTLYFKIRSWELVILKLFQFFWNISNWNNFKMTNSHGLILKYKVTRTMPIHPLVILKFLNFFFSFYCVTKRRFVTLRSAAS